MASVRASTHRYLTNIILWLILLVSAIQLLLLRPQSSTQFPQNALPPPIKHHVLLRPQPAPHVWMSHQQHAISTARNKTTNLWWKDSDKLPAWMKEYFAWHQESIRKLNDGTANAESYKYFVLRCLQRNKKCSGASDRLRTIPTALLLAHQSHRLLFILWDKPAPLEEFLVPPLGGLDWRLPVSLEEKIHVRDVEGTLLLNEETGRSLPNVTDRVVCMKSARGELYYNDHHHYHWEQQKSNEKDFLYEQVFLHVWNVFFQPSPAVQAEIDEQLKILHLQPGHYVSAHVRALYQSNAVEHHEEINAINCASQLGGGGPGSMLPIYFASDSNRTVAFAQEYGKSKGGARIITRASDREPLHLDRGRDFLSKAADEWRNHTASDFYDIFVDLYILSKARCITHGIGGYGKLAVLLSNNQSCSIDHRKTTCGWTRAID